MARFNPVDLTSTYGAVAALNSNFDDISSILERCLFRDGSGANHMLSTLDMNHNRIHNVGAPVSPTDAARLADLIALYGGTLPTPLLTTYTRTGDDTVEQTLQEVLDLAPITPEQFGAVGDGGTDDSNAFLLMNEYIQTQTKAVIEMRPGATYLVGTQRSVAPYWRLGEGIAVRDIDVLIVRGNGATMKHVDGLRFGTFDPVTGIGYDPGPSFTDYSKLGAPGILISAINVGHVVVEHLNLDGNFDNMIIGGQWGDVGWQVAHYGVYTLNCDHVLWNSVKAFNYGLDAGAYGQQGLDEETPIKPFLAVNCDFSNVGRNVVSLVGSNQAMFLNCNFDREPNGVAHPDAPGGLLNSSPAAAIDIEAEEALNRDTVINGCRLRAAWSFVSDSGDSANVNVVNSVLIGAVAALNPYIRFVNCEIFGDVRNAYGGASAGDTAATRFVNCYITDEMPNNDPATVGSYVIDTQAAPGTRFINCNVKVSESFLNLRNADIEGLYVDYESGTAAGPGAEFGIFCAGARMRNVRIVESIPVERRVAVNSGWAIELPFDAKDCHLSSPNNQLFWQAYTSGSGGGYVGYHKSFRVYVDPVSLVNNASSTISTAGLVFEVGEPLVASFSNPAAGLIVHAVQTTTHLHTTILNISGGTVDLGEGFITVDRV